MSSIRFSTDKTTDSVSLAAIMHLYCKVSGIHKIMTRNLYWECNRRWFNILSHQVHISVCLIMWGYDSLYRLSKTNGTLKDLSESFISIPNCIWSKYSRCGYPWARSEVFLTCLHLGEAFVLFWVPYFDSVFAHNSRDNRDALQWMWINSIFPPGKRLPLSQKTYMKYLVSKPSLIRVSIAHTVAQDTILPLTIVLFQAILLSEKTTSHTVESGMNPSFGQSPRNLVGLNYIGSGQHRATPCQHTSWILIIWQFLQGSRLLWTPAELKINVVPWAQL